MSERRHPHVADGSTFAPGLRLLPPHVRKSVERLYRVLRTLDDLVDDGDSRAGERLEAVERWAGGQRTHRDMPETRALEALAHAHPLLPRDAVLHFCAGMRHDLAGKGIDTEGDLERYCQRAGGAVGILVAHLLGTAGDEDGPVPDLEVVREAQEKMATLGRAMQVTNILRDIDEDLSHGRIYIPAVLIERFGFPAPGAREPLLRELIARADALYEEGAGAIPLLRNGRTAMALSAALYREILRQIERDGFGRCPGRAAVPAWRVKLLIAKYRTATVSGGLTE